MNDPWDVKSVRQANQYVSCMKMNGVPLLPPVLSKECRKEMQYYKILAREVEKRISLLKPYVDSDADSNEDKTDAPELPEYEQSYVLLPEEIRAGFNVNIDKITALTEKHLQNHPVINELCSSITSNVKVKSTDASIIESPKFQIDVSLSINDTGKNLLESIKETPHYKPSPIEIPERDYERKPVKEVLTDVETVRRNKDIVDFHCSVESNFLSDSDPFSELPVKQDGPSSLSSKSFTGSLNDIHMESIKEDLVPKLVRQRSYTLLKPSPVLIAHLEVQSLRAGVDMTSISMSESLSNLSSPNKKRRSWDLESAKVKWSSMAMELKTNVRNLKTATGAAKAVPNSNGNNNAQHKVNNATKPVAKKTSTVSPSRTNSVSTNNTRRDSLNLKTLPKSEPIQTPKSFLSPVRNIPANQTIVVKDATPKALKQKKESVSTVSSALISKSDDPATRVRELYEKIQKQQLMQMSSLVEKQKREQMMLQHVFEEQNNLLYKQLKTICPKSPVEVKEAWGDKGEEDRGPVSLSQLIKPLPVPPSASTGPVTSTLTETNNYINQCDNVLKKSRDITSTIKKQPPKCRSVTEGNGQSSKLSTEGSRTRTNSPTLRCASRKLNYDNSASSDREQEPILTDRTNDTMADLNNITFPSDTEDHLAYLHNSPPSQCKDDTKRSPGLTKSESVYRSTDNAIRSLENTIQHSMEAMGTHYKNSTRTAKQPSSLLRPPNYKEREAATTIVAYAKGYLVRRLLRTERVQATVQTIRDALLCALELHRDREGIRGADVDLHRRLIQQITAACYKLHDTFVASAPAERCAVIAADRARRRALAARGPAHPSPLPVASPLSSRTLSKHTDVMSQSHTGSFPGRAKRSLGAASLMTQSNYETFSGNKGARARCVPPSPRRARPWR